MHRELTAEVQAVAVRIDPLVEGVVWTLRFRLKVRSDIRQVSRQDSVGGF